MKKQDGEVRKQEEVTQDQLSQLDPQELSPAELKAALAQMTKLLQIQAVREVRLAKKEEEDLEKVEAKRHQREVASRSTIKAVIEQQKNCDHLKGGRNRSQTKQNPNYNISYHSFIDGTRRIRCHNCGMKWFKDDTREFLIRNGKKIPNHTGLGWNDALFMQRNTSNTLSASEMPQAVIQNMDMTPEQRAELQSKNEPKFEYEL